MHTFHKSERISLQREIDLLFTTGLSFSVYPLRILYLPQKPHSDAPVAVLIAVPKRRLKRAVARNRVKRLIRESYRLNKSLLLDISPPKNFLIAFLYTGNEVHDFPTLEHAMKIALEKLSRLQTPDLSTSENPPASD